MATSDIALIRQRFAETIRDRAHVRTEALVVALASIARERFLGDGPWHIGFFVGRSPHYRISETANPAEVYCDNVIAIDRARGLNNGEPSSLVRWIDAFALKPGQTVVHVGTGTGYYTALLAHVVGRTGRVFGYEVDPDLASRAQEDLAEFPWVKMASGNSYDVPSDTADAIFVNCGVTHPAKSWIASLRAGGTLLLPVTASQPGDGFGSGAMYLVKRMDTQFSLAYLSGVGIFNCVGQRDERLNVLLLSKRGGDWSAPRQLRLDDHRVEDSCWLHRDNCCYSTRPVTNAA